MADEYYIQSQIRHQEAQINELNAQKAQLERRLVELRTLEDRFEAVRMDFRSRQHARRVALAGVSSRAATSRTARRYQEGMSILLEGSHATQVSSGLGAGMDRIRQEIQRVVRQIEDIDAQIAFGHARIAELTQQYYDARNERIRREMARS